MERELVYIKRLSTLFLPHIDRSIDFIKLLSSLRKDIIIRFFVVTDSFGINKFPFLHNQTSNLRISSEEN